MIEIICNEENSDKKNKEEAWVKNLVLDDDRNNM